MRRASVVIVISSLVAASCASDTSPTAVVTPDETPATTEPRSTEPPVTEPPLTTTTTDAPPVTTTTTVVPPTTTHDHEDTPLDIDMIVDVAAEGTPTIEVTDCSSPAWHDLPATGPGEVTFVRSGDLVTVDLADSTVSCLATDVPRATSVAWSPAGDRLLVGADTIVSEAGIAATGFAPDTRDVSWSKPLGSALIAPTADGAGLDHRRADDPGDLVDVAGLTETWLAEYHPSGHGIFVAGVSAAFGPGLFLTDNHGGDVRAVALLQTDPKDLINDIAVSSDGRTVYFVHDHRPGGLRPGEPAGHVHGIQLPGLNLWDIGTFDQLPTGLVTSTDSYHNAWSVVDDDGTLVGGSMAHTFRFADRIVTPIGFVGDRLVVLARTSDDAPTGDVWIVRDGRPPQLLVSDVDAVDTRTIAGPFEPIPGDIEQQAPG